MKAAKGTYIFTLDDDQFISPVSLHSLQSINADLVGTEAWSMDDNFMAHRIEENKGALAYVGGGGLIVKKKVLEDIDYLDERYAPAWFSDSDLCFKARDKGYTMGYHPNPKMIHLGHQTVFKQTNFNSSEQWKKSHKLFKQKWTTKEIEKVINYLYTCDPEIPHQLDKQTIRKTLKDKPEVTFAMLSWKRVDKLFTSLDNYADSSYLPLNLILRVQGEEELTPKIKKQIEKRCKRFKSYKLFFTQGNEGTAKPRKWLSKQILKYYPNTKYFNFADDDMIYKNYAIDTAIILLDQLLQYDSINISWKKKGIRFIDPKKPKRHALFKLSPGINQVDMCGSATAFMRINILKKCEIDDNYFIALWDHDYHYQMYLNGFKMALYHNKNLNAKNDHDGYPEGGYADYKAVRRNKKIIEKSKKYFKAKWKQYWEDKEG